MALSEETRRTLRELADGTPWGEEAAIETAERLSQMGVDEDSILESALAVHEDYKERHGAEADQ